MPKASREFVNGVGIKPSVGKTDEEGEAVGAAGNSVGDGGSRVGVCVGSADGTVGVVAATVGCRGDGSGVQAAREVLRRNTSISIKKGTGRIRGE
jgi:hypothetical protein